MKPNETDKFEIDSLLHPARAFSHPDDVVNDPDLSLREKRAILSSWASDACSVEARTPIYANHGADSGFVTMMSWTLCSGWMLTRRPLSYQTSIGSFANAGSRIGAGGPTEAAVFQQAGGEDDHAV